MKRKQFAAMLCLLLAFVFVLSACDSGSSEEELFGSTAAKTTKATTATTAPPVEDDPIPTNLTAEILESNLPIGHLTPDKAITVPIDDKESITLNYQGWPTICKGEGDTLYAVSSLRIAHVDPFGAICFYESHDGGVTWSDPRIIIDTPLDDRDAGVVYLGNNRLLVSWFTHDTPGYFENTDPTWTKWHNMVSSDQKKALTNKWNQLDATQRIGQSYTAISTDGGLTWSEPSAVPVTAPHGPTLGNDGRTLMYIGALKNPKSCGFEDMKAYNLYVIKSTDFGKSWKVEAELPFPYKSTNGSGEKFIFGEPYILQLRDGSYIAAARGQWGYDNDAMRVYLAYSDDGRNWTDFKEVEGLVGAPAHFCQTKSGVLIMSYSYRVSPAGSRARLSYDGGKTWSEEITLCVSATPNNGDLGYPSTVELDDGTLITAYYQRVGSDSNASFLFTRWKLVEAE